MHHLSPAVPEDCPDKPIADAHTKTCGAGAHRRAHTAAAAAARAAGAEGPGLAVVAVGQLGALLVVVLQHGGVAVQPLVRAVRTCQLCISAASG